MLPAVTLDRIQVQHFTTQAAGEVARLGIYNDNGRGYPGTLLLDAGTVDLSTAIATKSITINQAVAAGLYWLVCVKQGTGSTSALVTFGADDQLQSPFMPCHSTTLFWGYVAWRQTGVTGALPSTFTTTQDPIGTGSSVSASPGVAMVAVRAA